MLKKINRLQKDRDFQKVFKGSRITKTENLVFRIAKRNEPYRHKSSPQMVTNETEEQKNRGTRYPNKLRSYKLSKGARFGFVVSNKINKRATRRNALKRRLRAAVRAMLPILPPNIDVIITIKRDFAYPYDFQTIRDQVQTGLRNSTDTNLVHK